MKEIFKRFRFILGILVLIIISALFLIAGVLIGLTSPVWAVIWIFTGFSAMEWLQDISDNVAEIFETIRDAV